MTYPQQFARSVITRTLRGITDGGLDVVWDGRTQSFGDPAATCRAVVRVEHPRLFSRVLSGGDIGFGEAYMDGDWSSPDVVEVLRLAIRNLALFEDRNRAFSFLARLRDRLGHWRRPNSVTGSRANIHYHYDIGNDFYRLFLDPSMAYSSGVYRSADDTLEEAQVEKFDRICRKLRLSPSDRVLEIGTGWGGFAAWAATNYGCHVTTTTISEAQHAGAAELFARRGLGPGRVRLLLEDYRNLSGRYDKIVSIEMFEAVGYRNYDTFFRQCDRLLQPEGTLLMQTITVSDQRLPRHLATPNWIEKYIFPGSELASVGGILQSLARVTKLSLFHAEEIGAHYARTLHSWRERFLGRLDEVRAMGFDDRFIRMWDYYLASCEAAFLERQVGNMQLLLTKTMNRRRLMGEPWEDEGRGAASPGPRSVAAGAGLKA